MASERHRALREAGGLLLALAACEVVSDLWLPVPGLLLHAALTAALLVRGGREAATPQGRFYLAASVLPLVRIITLGVAPSWFPGVGYYVVAESPILAAGIAVTLVLGLAPRDTGLRRPRHAALTVLTVLSGVVGGGVEYGILRPSPVVPGYGLDFGRIWLPGLLLILSTGFVEEFVFRGVLQPIATRWLGTWAGIAFTAVGWGLLHIGWDSALDVVFAVAIGLLWGWLREADDTILGTTLAHGLANVGLFLVAPFLP